MARSYTLHVSRDAPDRASALDRAEIVRDGFSLGAFLFTFLWCLRHRLWLAGFALLAAQVAFVVCLALLGTPPGAIVAACLLVNLLIGLEAASLRRWTLARHGRPAVDVVLADSLDEAEAKSFARYLAGAAREPAMPASPWGYGAGRQPPVLGLFPDAERSW